MAVPDSCDFESKVETELERKTTALPRLVWQEVRFWIAVLVGFAVMISYKSRFPTQTPAIDACVVVAVILPTAFIAGFSIRQTMIQIVKDLLQISSSN